MLWIEKDLLNYISDNSRKGFYDILKMEESSRSSREKNEENGFGIVG